MLKLGRSLSDTVRKYRHSIPPPRTSHNRRDISVVPSSSAFASPKTIHRNSAVGRNTTPEGEFLLSGGCDLPPPPLSPRHQETLRTREDPQWRSVRTKERGTHPLPVSYLQSSGWLGTGTCCRVTEPLSGPSPPVGETKQATD